MAGQPRKRAVRDEIARRAALEDMTPLEYVCDWVAGGESLSSLARDMKSVGATQPLVSRVVNAYEGSKAALAAARIDRGDALVDQAEQILANCGADKDEIALAKAQAEMKLWQAERTSRTMWGANDKQNISVNVSVGDLHLDALMQRNATRALPSPEIPEAEYEIVTGTQDAAD